MAFRIMFNYSPGQSAYYINDDNTLVKGIIKGSHHLADGSADYTFEDGTERVEGRIFFDLQFAKAHIQNWNLQTVIPEELKED